MGATPKKYRFRPSHVAIAYESGNLEAIARINAARWRTLDEKKAAAEERERKELEVAAITEQRIQQQRLFEELARKRATNEFILPINPEDEDLVPETPEQIPQAAELPTVIVAPSNDELLDRIYEQFRPSATGPVLVKQPREKPRTPAQQQADFLAAQLAANELHLNPATGELEPLSPPPSVDD